MTNKRGRPRVEQPGSAVMTWVRAGEHDQLIRLAKQQETSVSSLVRQLLQRTLPANSSNK